MTAENDRLDAVKAECLAKCGPHGARALEAQERADAAETPEERNEALAEKAAALGDEVIAHASHAEPLAEAYAAFAGRQVSNPATAGAVTALDADVVVESSAEPITDDEIDAALAAEAERVAAERAAAAETEPPEGG